MSYDVTRFVISKGVDNKFIFTIKQDNSTLPLNIVSKDTFVADLVNLETGTTHAGVKNKQLVVESAPNGKVSLSMTASETATLVTDKGSKTDRYYLRPTYKLVIKCSTANNGDFIAKVPEVYVD